MEGEVNETVTTFYRSLGGGEADNHPLPRIISSVGVLPILPTPPCLNAGTIASPITALNNYDTTHIHIHVLSEDVVTVAITDPP